MHRELSVGVRQREDCGEVASEFLRRSGFAYVKAVVIAGVFLTLQGERLHDLAEYGYFIRIQVVTRT